MPETEPATVVPGRVIDDLGAEFLHDAGGNRHAVTAKNIVIVDRVLRHHLVNVAGRVNGCPDVADVDGLALCNFAAHHVHPFGVVHDLFGNQQFVIYQAAQLAENFFHFLAQRCRLDQVAPDLLVIAEGSAAVHQRVVVTVWQTLGTR